MNEPDILAALRAVRDETARRHGGAATSLVRELTELSRLAGRSPVRLPQREPQPPRVPTAQTAAAS